jgi:glycerophosphoryl diester phosphodiesterase
MSFSPLALQRMRDAAPDVPRVFLMELLAPVVTSGQLPYGASVAGPAVNLLRSRPQLAERLHSRGYRLYVWTVNEPADVDLCVSLGVEGIISDRPAFVRERIGWDDGSGGEAADSLHGPSR